MENEPLTPKDTQDYTPYYSEDGFWKKLGKLASKAGCKVIEPALQLYYLLKSDTVSAKDKALIIGALGYLILPTDLIPDFTPLFGYTDDLATLMMVLKKMGDNLTPAIKQQARDKAQEWLAPKNKK